MCKSKQQPCSCMQERYHCCKPIALRPREANEVMNATSAIGTGDIANRIFGNSDTPTVTRHFHPFGCPVYALDDQFAARKSIRKWHKRARLGAYLGRRSLTHARWVALLVLNLETGHVSPQFHIASDDLFETVKDSSHDPNKWQEATKFLKPASGTTTESPLGSTNARTERCSNPSERTDGNKHPPAEPEGNETASDNISEEQVNHGTQPDHLR